MTKQTVGLSDHLQTLRAAILLAITEADMQVVVAKLLALARAGNLTAVALVFNLIGDAIDAPPADASGMTR